MDLPRPGVGKGSFTNISAEPGKVVCQGVGRTKRLEAQRDEKERDEVRRCQRARYNLRNGYSISLPDVGADDKP